jgi:predicted RNA-binding protein with PUA-like domain
LAAIKGGRTAPHARIIANRRYFDRWCSGSGENTMAYWLIKSEPDAYSFDDLVRDGRVFWDGVRNNTAALHLKAMRKGDRAFYYHSQKGLEVVGIGRFVGVSFAPVKPLPRPVTLAQMKANPALAGMAMLRLFRLSVSPVTADEWAAILKMGGVDP